MKYPARIIFPLYVKTPPFHTSGVDVNKNIMAVELAAKGYEVICLGIYKEDENIEEYLAKNKIIASYSSESIITYLYKSVQCTLVKEEKFFDILTDVIQPNDIVFVINKKSAEILKIAQKKKAISVAIIADAIVDRKELYALQPHYILYESEAVAAFGTKFHNQPFHIFPPPFLAPQIVQIPKKYKNRITLINPIPQKGGDVFFELSEKMPDHFFLAVEGWNPIPKDIKHTNVRYFNRQQSKNINFIYQETGILISPSYFNEAFGRTIIEAALLGVPSVVSNKGALPTTIGKGGIVVESYNTDDWKAAIIEVKANYEYYSKLAFDNAQQYLIDTEQKLKTMGIL